MVIQLVNFRFRVRVRVRVMVRVRGEHGKNWSLGSRTALMTKSSVLAIQTYARLAISDLKRQLATFNFLWFVKKISKVRLKINGLFSPYTYF